MRITSISLLTLVISTLFLLTGCQKVDLTAEGDDASDSRPGGVPVVDSAEYCPTVDTVYTNDIPDIMSVWRNHFVAYIEEDEENIGVFGAVLLAHDEATAVYSALNEQHSYDAMSFCASYKEDGITGWAIPPEDFAEYLRDVCADYVEDISELFPGCKPIVSKTESGNARYLCEDATKTFAFVTGTKVSAAGKTVKYHLRPVKYMLFITEDYGKNDNPAEPPTPPDTPSGGSSSEENPSTGGAPNENSPTDTPPSEQEYPLCYKWNGHVVVQTNAVEGADSIDIVLLSHVERSCKAAEAESYAAQYVEDGLTGWDVPSERLAGYLRDTYGISDNLAALNDLLAIPIVPRKTSGSGYNRYICEKGTRTYAFAAGNKIGNASNTTSYLIRYTKTVRIKKSKL